MSVQLAIIFICTLTAICYYLYQRLGYSFTHHYQAKGYSELLQSASPANILNTTKYFKTTSPVGQHEQNDRYFFEKFIDGMFSKEYFSLLHWSGHRFGHKNKPSSSLAPDLVYESQNKFKTACMAIACRWGACFENDSIEWAKENQIKHYYDFEMEEGINVFIIIGIGNLPTDPAELYIIPLHDISINDTSLHVDFLKHYKRCSSLRMFCQNDRSMLMD